MILSLDMNGLHQNPGLAVKKRSPANSMVSSLNWREQLKEMSLEDSLFLPIYLGVLIGTAAWFIYFSLLAVPCQTVGYTRPFFWGHLCFASLVGPVFRNDSGIRSVLRTGNVNRSLACLGGSLLDSAISLTDGARHPGVR